MTQLQEKQRTKLSETARSQPKSPSVSNGGGIIGLVIIMAIFSSCMTGLFTGVSSTTNPNPVASIPILTSPDDPIGSGPIPVVATENPKTKAGICKIQVPLNTTQTDNTIQKGDTPQRDGSQLLASSQTVDDTDAAQRKFVEAFHSYTEDQNPEGQAWALDGMLCASKRQWTFEVAANAALSYKQAQPSETMTPVQRASATEQPVPTQQATAQSVLTPTKQPAPTLEATAQSASTQTVRLQGAVELEQACTTLIREFDMVRVLAKSESLTARVKNLRAIPSKASLCIHSPEFKLQTEEVGHKCPPIPRLGGDEIIVNLSLKLDPEMHAEFALVHLGEKRIPLFVYAKQTLMQAHTYLSRSSTRPAANYDIETEAYTIRQLQPFEVDVVEGESPKDVSIALSEPANLIVAECGAGDAAATVGRVCKKLNSYSQTNAPTQP